MRVSARLDESRAQKLDFLRNATELGTSEVLKRAIDAYFEKYRADRPAEILRKTGFVGCEESDPDLSRRYKQELTELLDAKHGHR